MRLATCAKQSSFASARKNRHKTSIDQTLGVEWNFSREFKARIDTHLFFRGINTRLIGPHLPGKHDLLVGLGIDGAAKVGLFAIGDIVFPGFDDFDASIFFENLCPFFAQSR